MVFKHSSKLPQNYKHTARILKEVKEDNRGLKDSVYSKNASTFDRNKQRNMALATKILEKTHQIDHILRATQIFTKEPRLDPWIARVLIYELIWRKDLNSQCKPVQIIVSYKKEIQDALATYKGDDSLQPKTQVIKPRYARVNTFKMPLADVINQFRDEGVTFLPSVHETYTEYLEAVANLPPYHFMIDFHIKEMLVFHPNFYQIIRHPLYENGTLILQDKASCLTPLMLDPPPGSVVLDMCAAPGMKTNYLANLVGEKGRVYAVERNEERYQTMSELLNMHGLENVYYMNRDSLKLNGKELADVEYILVDPSCSGSGIKGRIEFENSTPERLKRLSNFQAQLLRHALSHFPNAKRVAYSTCSIHPEENEEVIVDVLKSVSQYQLVNLQEKMGNNWKNFGSDKYGAIGTSCLYSKQDDDFTNGFFVALFERKGEKSMKKRKYDESELCGGNNEVQNVDEKDVNSKKKKKSKDKTNSNIVEENENLVETIVEVKEKKKKKKGKTEELYGENNEAQNVDDKNVSSKKKRKSKDKTNNNIVEENENLVESIVEVKEKKKKKNGKTKETEEWYGENNTEEHNMEVKKKKRKKDQTNNTVEETETMEEQNIEIKEKKKNSKKRQTEYE